MHRRLCWYKQFKLKLVLPSNASCWLRLFPCITGWDHCQRPAEIMVGHLAKVWVSSMNKNTSLQCLVVHNLTEYLMPVLKSALVFQSQLLGHSMCSIRYRMGVVFVLPSSCNTGHVLMWQNSKWLPLYKWWVGAVDKTGNGRSEGPWKRWYRGKSAIKMEQIYV